MDKDMMKEVFELIKANPELADKIIDKFVPVIQEAVTAGIKDLVKGILEKV